MMSLVGYQIMRDFGAQDGVQFLVTDWADEGPGPNDPDPPLPPTPPPPQSAFV